MKNMMKALLAIWTREKNCGKAKNKSDIMRVWRGF
jgi:hypothetical protein